MARSLVLRCPKCGHVREAIAASRASSDQLGSLVQRAIKQDLDLELAEGAVEVCCECIDQEGRRWSAIKQFSLAHLLLVTTAVAAILALLRHPLSLLTGGAWKAALVPWSVYGWLFFGTDLADPKSIGSNPINVVAFCVSVVVAVLTGYAICHLAVTLFKRLWQRAHRARQ